VDLQKSSREQHHEMYKRQTEANVQFDGKRQKMEMINSRYRHMLHATNQGQLELADIKRQVEEQQGHIRRLEVYLAHLRQQALVASSNQPSTSTLAPLFVSAALNSALPSPQPPASSQQSYQQQSQQSHLQIPLSPLQASQLPSPSYPHQTTCDLASALQPISMSTLINNAMASSSSSRQPSRPASTIPPSSSLTVTTTSPPTQNSRTITRPSSVMSNPYHDMVAASPNLTVGSTSSSVMGL
jgi:hypothetical protein